MTAVPAPAEFPIQFAPTRPGGPMPAWTGRAFRVGSQEVPVLSYELGDSGWSDELTEFHEDTAGEHHYIDIASRRHAARQLHRWLRKENPILIDIGCSSGWMLKTLRDEFSSARLIGADYVRGPLEKLAQKSPGLPLLQFDLTACPLPDECVDGIVLLNVLEHIELDEAALFHVARILKPGGVVVIEVPAGPQLYNVYDKLLCHHRRYRMSELLAKVGRAGMRVLEKSHLGFFLYPPFCLAKQRGKRFLSKSEAEQKAAVSRRIEVAKSNPAMNAVMNFEAALRDRIYYPFGIRCLVTCGKAAA